MEVYMCNNRDRPNISTSFAKVIIQWYEGEGESEGETGKEMKRRRQTERKMTKWSNMEKIPGPPPRHSSHIVEDRRPSVRLDV